MKILVSSRALGILTLVLSLSSTVCAQETLQSALHAKLEVELTNVAEHLSGASSAGSLQGGLRPQRS